MTSSDGLVFNGRVPVGADKIDLIEIVLQVEPLASRLNLEDQHFILLRQLDISSRLSCATVKRGNVSHTALRKALDNGINFFSEMAENEFAVAVAFARQDRVNDGVHFAGAINDGVKMISADDAIIRHNINFLSKHIRKNANLARADEEG